MPVISHTIRGEATLVDHWTDPHYFTAAFPTLFPTGIGGHLDERSIPVSLVAFADWALRHHTSGGSEGGRNRPETEDPIIRRLLRNTESIGIQIPGSFAQKLRMRSEIRGLIPEYSGDTFTNANAAIREAAATYNPAAVAQFFHHICKAILGGLSATNTGRIGILGYL
ncbi:hypothetical protein ETB97_008830 [Aspergillus alliaceus]|uniref:Uncharacterized protein n=1 Tax=Petromyces alliaceus TaxID=209559 RepID=A0A8H5ZUR5_PETAA|nr:hypothetical protein ETB97_008830 [Aspergillus burnettii]